MKAPGLSSEKIMMVMMSLGEQIYWTESHSFFGPYCTTKLHTWQQMAIVSIINAIFRSMWGNIWHKGCCHVHGWTCLAQAFWQWAMTPEKLWGWCFSAQSVRKTSVSNTQLLLWMCFISVQAKYQSHSSNHVLVIIVLTALMKTWFSNQTALVAALMKMISYETICDHLPINYLLVVRTNWFI